MKSVLAFFIAAFIVAQSFAQGWRPGEAEVNVFTNGPSDLTLTRSLGLAFEYVTTDGRTLRCYAVPSELERIKASGLHYEVTIPDMNRHYEHFWDQDAVPSGYYTYDQIISIADSLVANFPSICKKVMWGTSMGGRQLAALKISDNVNTDENEAEIMFDGGIHGDEVGGSQNIIMFARDLCLAYNVDPDITNLINNREIWLYLMVNPDGRVFMSRYNNNYVDINRDNGYMWNAEGQSTGAFSQIESKALRNCIFDNQFVVYTNYHSGTEIISYPWSYRPSATRDNAHIDQLASYYALASGYSALAYGQGYNVMYAINGSTKDVQYGSLGNVGWSIEISDSKQPPASQIQTFYNNNKPAMLEVIDRCGSGVSGTVTDSVTGNPVRAIIWVSNYFPVYTDPLVGDYHKYVLPGSYTIKVTANGYKSKTLTGVGVPSAGAVVKDFQLAPLQKRYAYKVMSCQIPGNNFDDESYTPGALGKPDSIPYSLGRYGWIVLDMGDTICDGPGVDFKVFQAGTTNKNYIVSGGNSPDGPFTTIGSATGSAEFDIGTVGLTKARYLYIVDDGTGPSFGPGVGFNLDAVEMVTPPLIVNFTASNQNPCMGSTVDFTDQSGGNVVSWNWSFPGGTPSSSTQQNPTGILYNTPGNFNVSLTISNGTTSSTQTKPLYIGVMNAPQVALGSDTSVCAWSGITLDAGNPGSTYLWSTGATTRTIHVDSTGTGLGTGTYWVDVASTSFCLGSDTIKVSYHECTGINEQQGRRVADIFPNPAAGSFTVKATGFRNGEWQLLSVTGSRIFSGPIPGEVFTQKVETGKLNAGVYFLMLRNGDYSVVKKVVISMQ